jgi:hypothetical protein
VPSAPSAGWAGAIKRGEDPTAPTNTTRLAHRDFDGFGRATYTPANLDAALAMTKTQLVAHVVELGIDIARSKNAASQLAKDVLAAIYADSLGTEGPAADDAPAD